MLLLPILKISILFTAVIAKEQCNRLKAYENYEEAKDLNIIKNITKNDYNLGRIEDQKTTGNCYAHVIADMTENRLKSNHLIPSNRHLSPMAIAVSYQQENIKQYNHYFYELAKSKKIIEKISRPYIDALNTLEKKVNEKKKYPAKTNRFFPTVKIRI